MTAEFELLVVGADEASMSAAAIAARGGASTALLRAPTLRPPRASYCNMPNFVWRRLNLHTYGLELEPVSARITILENGEKFTTFEHLRQTISALHNLNIGDDLIWQDFVKDMKTLRTAAVGMSGARENALSSIDLNMVTQSDARALMILRQATSNCRAVLDDYLESDAFKTHLSAHALSPSGLGGIETGSAYAMASMLDDYAWPMRSTEQSPSLLSTLESVCRDGGVTFIEKVLQDIGPQQGKYMQVSLAGGEIIKTRKILFATPDALLAAGCRVGGGTMIAAGSATAELRIILKQPLSPTEEEEKAIFQIVDSADTLSAARQAALAGRLPEKLPIQFQYLTNGELVVRCAYCPSLFQDENGPREWTGQDRQVLTRAILDQLSSALPEVSDNIKNTKLEIYGASSPDRQPILVSGDNIYIQQDRHNAVAAAVRLVDEVFGGG